MKYAIGIKGQRQVKNWKPKTKIRWAISRAAFLKQNGLLISKWG